MTGMYFWTNTRLAGKCHLAYTRITGRFSRSKIWSGVFRIRLEIFFIPINI